MKRNLTIISPFLYRIVRQERVKLITLVQLDKLVACEDDMTFFKAGLS